MIIIEIDGNTIKGRCVRDGVEAEPTTFAGSGTASTATATRSTWFD